MAFPANPGTAGDARVPYCHLHQVALAKSIPQDAYGKELPPVIYYVIILLYYTIHYEYQWKTNKLNQAIDKYKWKNIESQLKT